MNQLTNNQVYELVTRAKAGDGEACYKLSLYARKQAKLNPTEKRWFTVAVKTFVKAIKLDYAPAVAEISRLLKQEDNNAGNNVLSAKSVPSRFEGNRTEVTKSNQLNKAKDDSLWYELPKDIINSENSQGQYLHGAHAKTSYSNFWEMPRQHNDLAKPVMIAKRTASGLKPATAIVCPKCGRTNMTEAKFCLYCGTYLYSNNIS